MATPRTGTHSETMRPAITSRFRHFGGSAAQGPSVIQIHGEGPFQVMLGASVRHPLDGQQVGKLTERPTSHRTAFGCSSSSPLDLLCHAKYSRPRATGRQLPKWREPSGTSFLQHQANIPDACHLSFRPTLWKRTKSAKLGRRVPPRGRVRDANLGISDPIHPAPSLPTLRLPPSGAGCGRWRD